MGFISDLIDNAVDGLGFLGLDLYTHIPEILLGTGIVSMGGALVASGVASRKLDEIMEDHNLRVAAAKAPVVVKEDGTQVARTEKEIRGAVVKEYGKTTLKVSKNYAVMGTLTAISLASFGGMYRFQAVTIDGLAASYMGLKAVSDHYMKKNIELNGMDSHLQCLGVAKQVDVVDEKGEVVGKKLVPIEPEDGDFDGSWFDSDEWIIFGPGDKEFDERGGARNAFVIDRVQEYVTDLYYRRGYVSLNDVREKFGKQIIYMHNKTAVEETNRGMRLGWANTGKDAAPLLDYNSEDVKLFNAEALKGVPGKPFKIHLNLHGDIIKLRKQMVEERKGK